MRSALYDRFVLKLTTPWYAEVFQRLVKDAVVLDVGVGTAGALLANADAIRDKRLHVVGIDIDADYIAHARRRLPGSGVEDRVELRQESVYDHQGGPYEAVYFSASFMLLPEPEHALTHCCGLLKPGGRIYFTQTIQQRRARWQERLKPMLRRVTTIDFGRVTYEADFRAHIRSAGLELEEFTVLSRHGGRVSCIAVARPSVADVNTP
ncbi:methyltransferase type 11 [Thioalkalivibrio versutus]|uniref:Methyltransferase type 11 n=1 Tax=Thioalkalivibrio versutus TaxID=106634 RepID=A0A0G3G7R4_9GAMM|nr:class I SAM-dependent methyltransferase [Thioalkalivibrio versutus]AKJ94916.1 methyltransferase type 11 [Thioalkalivibrio versutus]